jgi:hypothetical protein
MNNNKTVFMIVCVIIILFLFNNKAQKNEYTTNSVNKEHFESENKLYTEQDINTDSISTNGCENTVFYITNTGLVTSDKTGLDTDTIIYTNQPTSTTTPPAPAPPPPPTPDSSLSAGAIAGIVIACVVVVVAFVIYRRKNKRNVGFVILNNVLPTSEDGFEGFDAGGAGGVGAAVGYMQVTASSSSDEEG